METKQFLDLVLGSEGYYCVWANNPAKQVQQKFYTSIDEVISEAHDLSDNGWSAFFALGTFEKAGSRVADNVMRMKSFFLDLDCGPDKEFANQETAIAELRDFCKQHSLPTPTLINSGRGIHVYWILSDAVARDDWWPVAERLKNLCTASGFKADPSVTSDAARVLRVPSTYNYKYDPPLPVTFLGVEAPTTVGFEDFSALLGGDPIPVPTKYTASTTSAFQAALNENQKGSFKRLLVRTAKGTGCAQIQHIVENQKTISHDLWRSGLSIANVCKDGDKAAELMSSGHEDYSLEATLHKMADTGGPHFCSTFELHNPEICAACPNKGKISTPAMLTKEIRAAAPEDNIITDVTKGVSKLHEIPTFPAPYFRGQNGGVYLRGRNADGDPEEVCVYHYDFYVTRRLHDVEQGEVVAFALHLPKDGVREFTIPLTAITSKEDFRKNMAMKGITAYGVEIDKLMRYTAAWINELQQTTTASEAHQQFGWVEDNDMDTFVLGDKLITAHEVEYNPPSAKTSGFIDAFTPKGTKERNREILHFFGTEGLELHQFTILGGFASVLMPLTGLNSLGVHLQGGSGIGKTTALYCNMSPWGDPHYLTLGEEDTPNSRMNRGEVMHNLPLNTDEMTNMTGLEVSRYAYKLAEGKQKNRLAGGGNMERVRGKPWRLLAFSTGNESCYEQMMMVKGAPKAEMQRMLELRVDPNLKAVVNKDKTDRLFQDIQQNYGHFGIEYVQYIIQHREDLERQFREIKAELDNKAGLAAENRFWSGGCAVIILSSIITRRLGITNYSTSRLFNWVVEELRKVKALVDDTGPSVQSVLTEFATENWSNILKIKSTETAHTVDGVAPMVIPEQNPRNTLVARFETDTSMFYIVPKALRNHLGLQHLNYNSTVDAMIKQLGAKKITMRLSKGTNFNLPPIRVIAVKLEGITDVSEPTEG